MVDYDANGSNPVLDYFFKFFESCFKILYETIMHPAFFFWKCLRIYSFNESI